jgi:citrate lyase subunit alpha/citrate CoA-transferase
MEVVQTSLGREIPAEIPDYGEVRPFRGASVPPTVHTTVAAHRRAASGESKVLKSLREAIEKSGLRDGMTVSFHHHLRNGDKVVNQVMQAIAEAGLKDIHLAASGLFQCHEPLVELMEQGVITKITTSTFNPGAVPKAITAGKLQKPAVLMTHGGRPRAVAEGELHIDVAFIAAPSCDCMGNLNGTTGPSACGFLSYAYADAQYADCVVAVTDHLVDYPCMPIEISQEQVDYVVQAESIGDPSGIVSGTTQITTDPIRLGIAADTARLIDASGYLKPGMSFQTGAGTTSLAVAAEVGRIMHERGIVGSFASGGIHAYLVQMLEEGLFRALLDVQCFDLEAVRSARDDPRHLGMSAAMYGDPHSRGCMVDNLDVVILGATEIDLDFNVNVVTGSTGTIMGASGGHSDTAAGAKLTIVVSNLMKKTRCLVKRAVTTVTTPGETIDALVTEYGIAVNPRRTDLLERLSGSGLPLVSMESLLEKGYELGAQDDHPNLSGRIVAVVEYRDGTVIDTVRQPIT